MLSEVGANVTDRHKPIILDLGPTRLLKSIHEKSKTWWKLYMLVKFRISYIDNFEKEPCQHMLEIRLINS